MSRFIVGATWADAPHLSEATKEALFGSYQPFQRDARTRGIPALGSGAVYQIAQTDIRVDPFKIPAHWPRAYGMDTDQGDGFTAATWGALDPETLTLYLYDCYKRQRQQVSVNARAIKDRGELPGVADAAALQMTPKDAEQLIRLYQAEGLDLRLPDKAVESGIEQVWQLMTGGRFKVFASLSPWFGEYRLYRRDEHGRIVKKNDHLMDATRYLVRSGMKRARALIELATTDEDDGGFGGVDNRDAWMG